MKSAEQIKDEIESLSPEEIQAKINKLVSGDIQVKLKDMSISIVSKLQKMMVSEMELWESIIPDPTMRTAAFAAALRNAEKMIHDAMKQIHTKKMQGKQ